jgi:hypothetical protein
MVPTTPAMLREPNLNMQPRTLQRRPQHAQTTILLYCARHQVCQPSVSDAHSVALPSVKGGITPSPPFLPLSQTFPHFPSGVLGLPREPAMVRIFRNPARCHTPIRAPSSSLGSMSHTCHLLLTVFPFRLELLREEWPHLSFYAKQLIHSRGHTVIA